MLISYRELYRSQGRERYWNAVRRLIHVWLRGGFLLALLLKVPSAGAQQTSHGDCSPIVSHVGGNVIINCSNKVLDFLVDEINKRNADIQAKTAEIRSWVDRYLALQQSMGSSEGYNKLRTEAFAAFNKNDLDTAGQKLDIVIDEQERKQIAQAAQDHFNRAEIFVFQNNPKDARRHYRRAFELRPDNPKFAAAYARSQCDQNETGKARDILHESVEQLRSLAASDHVSYSADLVCALVNLAGVYNRLGHFPQSKTAADEALDVANRLLAKSSDKETKIHLADALTAAGAANVKTGNSHEGSEQLERAESLYADVKVNNSNRPYIHEMLARVARDQGNRAIEGKRLLRALELEKDLVKRFPIFFRPKLAEYYRAKVAFLQRDRTIDSIGLLYESYRNFINDAGLDQVTATFLLASAEQVWATVDCLERDNCHAPQRPLQAFGELGPKLTSDESRFQALAFLDRGVMSLKTKDYESAKKYFLESLKISPGFRVDQRRVAQAMYAAVDFFKTDFGTAARNFIELGSGLTEDERVLWNYIISTVAASGAGPPVVLNYVASDPLLIAISRKTAGQDGHLENSRLVQMASQSQSQWRCRDILILRHYLTNVGDPIPDNLMCTVTIDHDPYSWILISNARHK